MLLAGLLGLLGLTSQNHSSRVGFMWELCVRACVRVCVCVVDADWGSEVVCVCVCVCVCGC